MSKVIFNAAFALVFGMASLACSDGKTKGGAGAGGSAAGTGGSGGASGSAGSGGTGGGGTNERCAMGATVAVGDKPLVDDFNDGDLVIIHPMDGVEDGRSGEAALYNSEDMTAKLEPLDGALHFVANPNMQWPSFGIPIANCYNASAYTKGISFKIKGTAKDTAGKDIAANSLKFAIATPVSTPEPAGRCVCADPPTCSKCYDSFGYFIPGTLPTEYTTIEVLWGQLKQGGWGTPAPAGYDPKTEIMELDWGVGVNVGAFDIYIDDVSFLQ